MGFWELMGFDGKDKDSDSTSHHNETDRKIYKKISEINPKLKYGVTVDPTDRVDLVAVDDEGNVKAVFEAKSRSKEKCKYIRRDNSLIVDSGKVDAMSEISGQYNCKAFVAQNLEDQDELTLMEVANKGAKSTKLKEKKMKANKTTRWSSGKVEKVMTEYSLDDCNRYPTMEMLVKNRRGC
jgi:hypothetical protein